MTKKIWFDMDGTFVDFYGVENWLDYIINENTKPYEIAKPLFNMQVFARVLNKLQKNGYEIGIISWTAGGNTTAEYNEKVKIAKMAWIKKHLASVKFNNIDIVPYGTPKEIGRMGILFDDEIGNRQNWKGIAYDTENIIEILKAL